MLVPYFTIFSCYGVHFCTILVADVCFFLSELGFPFKSRMKPNCKDRVKQENYDQDQNTSPLDLQPYSISTSPPQLYNIYILELILNLYFGKFILTTFIDTSTGLNITSPLNITTRHVHAMPLPSSRQPNKYPFLAFLSSSLLLSARMTAKHSEPKTLKFSIPEGFPIPQFIRKFTGLSRWPRIFNDTHCGVNGFGLQKRRQSYSGIDLPGSTTIPFSLSETPICARVYGTLIVSLIPLDLRNLSTFLFLNSSPLSLRISLIL